MDDLTVAEALLLKERLVEDESNTLVSPLKYHDIFKLLLPETNRKVQKQLEALEAHALVNEMKINKKNTKSMPFNTSKIKISRHK